MITKRRNFIKSLAVLGSASMLDLNAGATTFVKKRTAAQKLQLKWAPYNLEMKHVFTIANSSRKTTPVVLTSLTYDGVTGYGEASLPPYLGES